MVMLAQEKLESEKNYFKRCIDSLNSIVEDLEYSVMESNQIDRKMLREVRMDNLKNQGLCDQLEEAQKENSQLLNILEQRCEDNDGSRVVAKLDISSSCSTMSLVHLQYKYEELLANHNGLLKVLDMRTSDLRRCQEENGKLKENMENLKMVLEENEEKISKVLQKLFDAKAKKNRKISRLQKERDSLKMVHNQLVVILHRQCMEKDDFFVEQIRHTDDSEKALLFQEIRKNNILTYENFQQQQEIEYLRSILKATSTLSKEMSAE